MDTPVLVSALNLDCVNHILSFCDDETLEVLRHVPDVVGHVPVRNENVSVLKYAIAHGYLSLAVWARTSTTIGHVLSSESCNLAARGGHTHILHWLRSCRFPWGTHTFNMAVEGGHLDTMKYLRENGCSWEANSCLYAASEGHLEALEWLVDNGCKLVTKTCLKVAASHGHLNVIEWLYDRSIPGTQWECVPKRAALHGHLHILEWARRKGIELHYKVYESAAGNGHLNILKYADENDICYDPHACAYLAATNGHLDVFKYVWEREDFDGWFRSECFDVAFGRGHFDVSEWLANSAGTSLVL